MDALVLAGGFAKRMEPLGEFVPKAFLTLNGKPLIEYIMNDLESLAAVTRIVVSTNERFKDQFDYWINLKRNAGFKKKIDLVIEPTVAEGHKFGAIKGTAYALEKANVSDDFLVILGDNYYTFDLGAIMQDYGMSEKISAPGMVVYDIGFLEGAKQLGVVKVSDGKVVALEEKPENPTSSLISAGIYFFPKSAVGLFEKYIESGSNTDAIGLFLKWLIGQTEVKAIVPKKGEWFDIGTISNYRQMFYRQKYEKNGANPPH